MDDGRTLGSIWQSLLREFQPEFTQGGWVRFVDWITGTVLCDEEHTVTQILTSVGLESRWRAVEAFVEYGSWDRQAVERRLMRVIDEVRPTHLGGYRVMAIDDTKEHRTSSDVWGTCTFHESSARSPNRAETVRAHNWVAMGHLTPGKPWTYLPCAARLYFRKSHLPVGEEFKTKTAHAVDMLRVVDEESARPILAAFDGAYAMETVIRPCLNPPEGARRIDFVTRLRRDARLYHPLVNEKKNPKGGRPRQWGRRMASPQNHAKWDVDWQTGRTYIHGRTRSFRCKRVLCQWSVSGPEHLIFAYVFEVRGYRKPWYVVTSAMRLSAAQVVAVQAARFRQEDGFRDHKQRLGMEECRAWTKEPVLRTFQVQMVAQSLLRLTQFQLDATWGEATWWHAPEWNRRKRHPSLLDLRRLFRRHRPRCSKLLCRLEEMQKPPQAHFPCGRATARAA
ncbi:MAG TPA: transposase [Thermoguttaceae bacterium]|nr:transposase [Thermoguttaceae bacterium]